MRRTDPRLVVAIVAGAVVSACALSACASNPRTPPGYLSDARSAGSDAYGGWLVAESSDGLRIDGELIAVGPDSVFVLAARLVALPRARIRSARLVTYNPRTNQVVLWAVLGGLTSPLVNGFFSIFMAPAWATAGILGARSTNQASRLEIPQKASWEKAAAYARFPQGLPPTLARGELRPKPLH